MAWCIQEGELSGLVVVLDFDLIRTDVLGDATGFACGNARFSDRVQQAGFAVVDVAHHGDDGGRRIRCSRSASSIISTVFLAASSTSS